MTDAAADRLRPDIPGLTVRSYRAEDAAPISDLLNRGNEADGVNWRTDAAELGNWYSRGTEKFDPARDLSVVEVDGVLVAHTEVEWVDTNDGLREFRLGATVDPAWRRRGIGRWLLRRMEEHARSLLASMPTERPVVLGTWSADTAVGTRALMSQAGYSPVRYFFDMVRPSLESIEAPVLPEGLELRPVETSQLKQLWDADVEAFRDHWGGFDGSDTRFEQWKTDPKFEPDLWVVAWDGDEIAGGVINEINRVENEAFNRKRGWLASVFVRRPWRRRGLARAMVLRSLEMFRERGMTSAGLGVDADNPTGALGLYTSTGFEVEFRSTAFRKPMEALDD
jgi:mycothiol synthase